MRNILLTYLAVLVVLAAVDFVWLGLIALDFYKNCLLYTSPSPRDGLLSRMPSSA